jgi:hypothetical protein
MHDTDANPSPMQPGTLHEQGLKHVPYPAAKGAATASAAQSDIKKAGLVRRLLMFVAGLLGFKPRAKKESAPEFITATDDRAAVARAAQLPPPMAFKGDTANTLAIPMGAYAGKPVEQAMHKRAEQQFKTMDITRSTMH